MTLRDEFRDGISCNRESYYECILRSAITFTTLKSRVSDRDRVYKCFGVPAIELDFDGPKRSSFYFGFSLPFLFLHFFFLAISHMLSQRLRVPMQSLD